MLDRISYAQGDPLDSVRKRNIQAVLGLLKMRSAERDTDLRHFRIQKSEFQKNVLRDVYKLTRFPSKQTREDLALLLNHTTRGIQIWFQNQRNNREDDRLADREAAGRGSRIKRGNIDILTLVRIIDSNMPGDKKQFWERFINYMPQYL